MRREQWLVQLLVCAVFASALVAVSARAQAEAPGAAAPESSEYERYIAQALQAYDAGRFAEARSSFRRAHELAPTARTLRTIGMCSFNLGDYVDALQNLEAALADARKPLNGEQRTHVSDLIARSQARVGRFRIRLTPQDAVLWADGRPPPRLGTDEILLEPGRHELLAQASGHQPNRSTVQVDGGDRTTLEIILTPHPAGADIAAVAAPKPAEAPSPAPVAAAPLSPASTASNTQAVWGYVALGVGGVSLITFGITTGLAASKASSLDEHCRDNACRPAYHDDVDTYNRYKVISTVSLIAGVALAGTGVVLLLTQPGQSTEHAALEPQIGFGSLGVRGHL